jgi:hypothetical protein
MGLEPMTSPLPRECSTTELHQPSCSNFLASSRARLCASTTRKPNIPRTKIGSHRSSMSRSSKPTYRLEKPCTWNTADASIVNHDSTPKTTKTPNATYIRRVSAAGLSDRSLSVTTGFTYLLLTLYYLPLKNGAQGRIRTSVAHNAADLQSAAINHSATCAFHRQATLPQPIHSLCNRPHETGPAQKVEWRTLQGEHLGRYNQLSYCPRKSGAGEGI